MRNYVISTLSNVVELGVFAAAAGLLAFGMLHLK